MVDLSKVSGFVQKFVEEVNLSDGNLEKLSKAEFNKLSEYLANNSDMKPEDKEFIQGYMIEHTSSKDLRKWSVQGNKTTEKADQSYSFEDLTKAFGKKSSLVNALEVSGLIEKLDNGEYSVEKLTALIKDALGFDEVLNVDKSVVPNDIDFVKYKFQEAGLDAEIISQKDIKNLVKFLGFDVESNNAIKKIYDKMLKSFAKGVNLQGFSKVPPKVEIPIIDEQLKQEDEIVEKFKNNPKIAENQIFNSKEIRN